MTNGFSARFCRDGVAKLKECKPGVVNSALTTCDLDNLLDLVFLIIISKVKIIHLAMYMVNYIRK